MSGGVGTVLSANFNNTEYLLFLQKIITVQIPFRKYRIVDSLSSDKAVRIPDAIAGEVFDLFEGSLKGRAYAKEKLQKLIHRHPNVPMLKYCLLTWYVTKNQRNVADKISDEL